ncbi:MAG: response regulator [Candidatus Kuenenia sp.]|nr:response regulator [Candidatus Kuenenia hertensis]
MNETLLFASNKLDKYDHIIYYLKQHGFVNILTASNGEEALKLLDTQTPDIAFLDTDLPVLNGFQLCKLMNSSPFSRCNNIPVILVSDSQKNCMVFQLAKCIGAYLAIHPSFPLEDLLYLMQNKLKSTSNKITVNNIKVLIVSNDQPFIQLTKNYLLMEGYDVSVTGNGEEALHRLEKEKLSIMFLGNHLPESNVSELIRKAKESIPELFITIIIPQDSEWKAIELLKAGANDYIIQPKEERTASSIFANTLTKYHFNLCNQLLGVEELKLHSLIDGIIDGIIFMDKSGKITTVNKAADGILSQLNLVRSSDGSIIKIDSIATKDIYSELFDRKQLSVYYEINITGEVERHFHVIAYSVNQFIDEKIHVIGDRRKRKRLTRAFTGNNIGIVIVLRDVTREHQLTNQVVKSERLFAVSNLVAGAAHELNNPLAGIQLCTELVLNDPAMSEKALKYLHRIQKETEQIQDVVKSLLTFTGNYTLSKEQININEIIEEIIKQKTYQFDHANIKTIILLGNVLPFIFVDKYQIRRVLLNIIENACAALEVSEYDKCLTIKTESLDNVVKTTISDTGPGIPKENLSKIFEPFFTKRANKKKKGTGLGLSIAQSIIQQHNGKIYVQSEEGKGATFVIELPAMESH